MNNSRAIQLPNRISMHVAESTLLSKANPLVHESHTSYNKATQ